MSSTPFLGEIRIFSFNFAPKGWAMCNGQTLAINQNQAIFSLLGTTYGGNGIQTFALPNLQSRVAVGSASTYTLGQLGGEESHTLSLTELPAHTHLASADNSPAASFAPTGNLPSNTAPNPIYSAGSTAVAMAATMVMSTGGSLPHENRQPFLAVNFCIALQGIFPTRN